MSTTRITVSRHTATGLLVARSDEFPGFIVHAHSEDELAEKLGAAFQSYMRAIGHPVEEVNIQPETKSPGFASATYHAAFLEVA